MKARLDLKLTLEVLLEEYRQTMSEVSEYQKNGLQLTSIFLVFFPVALGFAHAGEIWIYPLLQLFIPVFMSMISNLDNNVMMDSAHAVSIERKINAAAGQNLISWQTRVNYLGKTSRRGFAFFIAPILIATVFFLFYGYTCYEFLKTLSTRWHQIAYAGASLLAYTALVLAILAARSSAVRKIEKASTADSPLPPFRPATSLTKLRSDRIRRQIVRSRKSRSVRDRH